MNFINNLYICLVVSVIDKEVNKYVKTANTLEMVIGPIMNILLIPQYYDLYIKSLVEALFFVIFIVFS